MSALQKVQLDYCNAIQVVVAVQCDKPFQLDCLICLLFVSSYENKSPSPRGHNVESCYKYFVVIQEISFRVLLPIVRVVISLYSLVQIILKIKSISNNIFLIITLNLEYRPFTAPYNLLPAGPIRFSESAILATFSALFIVFTISI